MDVSWVVWWVLESVVSSVSLRGTLLGSSSAPLRGTLLGSS
jgi:hypothetical protein